MVITETKANGLFLNIHLSPSASPQECLKALSKVQKIVDNISPPDMRDESDEILFGIGFGPNFLEKVKDSKCKVEPFIFKSRFGQLGDMPSTGGDIFIHAKCDEHGKLFQLTSAIVDALPDGAVDKFTDTYGWVYRGGRDLSGFIDGTENPADEDDRYSVAVNATSGGSYLVAQKWIHKHKVIKSTHDALKEKYVGRMLEDSTELKQKAASSHVARMVGNTDLGGVKKFQVVRQSQPWGTVSGESGLYFMAYASTPKALDWMLDRMTGYSDDKLNDDIMRLSTCVSSTYLYFPSQEELTRMFKAAGAGGSWF